ncbi:MAG: 16S rRNA (cytidine(1402)-2'-O)-methyltransferase [Acidobacteria bacterium]|nr:16S rRNA (cytidine(1402)-2'-O)-methyltransferase [Acidobacteriota bacterium]
MAAGTLYIVATPIGNLQDMTFRGVEVLRSVDLIACEDTRHTQKLLNHFRISNRTVSYHEHNEHEQAERLLDELLKGRSVAVVSDAGMPGVCDPGLRIVARASEAGIKVVPVPGPAAFVAAAAAAGLATDSLFFGGFLPSKKGERRKRLAEIAAVPATLALYETPHRLGRSLADCYEVLGDRRAVVARELTKLHEEFVRGCLSELAERYSAADVKGEIVLLIERGSINAVRVLTKATAIPDRIREIESEGIDHKAAIKKAAKEFGISRSEAYRILQSSKEG